MNGPFANVRFVPTGGIDVANLAAYLALPNVIACGGSWMVAPQLLAGPDLDTIRRLSSAATAIVRDVRAGSLAASPSAGP